MQSALTFANGYPYTEIGYSLIYIRDNIFFLRGNLGKRRSTMARKLLSLRLSSAWSYSYTRLRGWRLSSRCRGGYDQSTFTTWTETHGYNVIPGSSMPREKYSRFANGNISGWNSENGISWMIGAPVGDGISSPFPIRCPTPTWRRPRRHPEHLVQITTADAYEISTYDVTPPDNNYWTKLPSSIIQVLSTSAAWRPHLSPPTPLSRPLAPIKQPQMEFYLAFLG